MTLSHYLSIFYSSRSEDIITYGRTKISILVTVLFSVLYNVPRFFEISWQEFTNEDPVTGQNVTRAETIPTGPFVCSSSYCHTPQSLFLYRNEKKRLVRGWEIFLFLPGPA